MHRSIEELQEKAVEIRKKILEISAIAGGGHLGGSLSMVEILVALYYHAMRYNPKEPRWPQRDRFVLSKGHGILGLCPILADLGFYPEELWQDYGRLDSAFGMHPNMDKIPGIDMSTGSLGHGLSVGVGMALAGRLDQADWRVFVLLGDGELDEGSNWEAAMSASHFQLGNLVAIIDRNGLQVDGSTEEVMALEPLAEKWRAFGWRVIELDGHDLHQLVEALDSLPPANSTQPTCIIAKTVKGKGVSFMEGKGEWHYGGLDEEHTKQALEELERSHPGRR